MRFQFEAEKNRELPRRHGVSLEEGAQDIFARATWWTERASGNPGQLPAMGGLTRPILRKPCFSERIKI